MISAFGHFSLSVAVLAAAGAVLAAVAGVRLRSALAGRVARWCVALVALMFTVASAALLAAFLGDHFQFDYVLSYSERALPLSYKIAAFWAGQSGSLLLWGWMLAIMCVIAVIGFRKRTDPTFTIAIAVMGAACAFFAILMLAVPETNPFAPWAGPVPPDGRGLNPMLQDPAMIIHPPLLFLGYAGFTVPFAVMCGALIAGRDDNLWLADIRRWVIASWVFLTAGIVLGAWWAYVELGWGGYWAWDPVENASLLPWFTSTALLHTMIVHQHRGMFKRWTVALIAATFILCVFGTYLTRSGVLSSVHAFAESWVGKLFLGYIVLLVALSVGLFIWRWRQLRPERELEGLISREGAFLLSNTLFVAIMLTTLIGTIFPLLSDPFGHAIEVKQQFYNRVAGPFGLVIAFLMAHGPVLVFGRSAFSKIAYDMLVPGIVAVLAVIYAAVFVMGGEFTMPNIWALVCTFIAVLGALAVVAGLARAAATRRRATGENWLAAAIRLVDADKRRYGAQVTHLGMMMIVIGITGSKLFEERQQHVLRQDVPVAIGDFALTLKSIEQIREANFDALEATIALEYGDGEMTLLRPQKRFYDKWRQQSNSEIALASTLKQDVYVILDRTGAAGTIASIEVLVSPLLLWIWLGGLVMLVGGVYCMLPRFIPKRRAALLRQADAAALEEPAVSPPVAKALTPDAEISR